MDNYEEFKEELKSELTESLESRGYQVDIVDTTAHKANQDLDGITIRLDGASVSPTIYTESTFEHFSESGMDMHELAERLADTTEAAYKDFDSIGFDPKDFNADYVKENSYLSVVNTDMNQDLLSRVPHEEIPGTDLSAYAKVSVGDNASITITNDHAFQMGMTGSEVLDAARENTLGQDFSVKSMQDTLSEMMPDMASDGLFPMPEETHPSMCVITNESRVEGANAILSKDTLDAACEKMGCDSAVIMPSSRHELLAVNPEAMGMESTSDLKAMVEEVNATQVDLADKLSDNIYEYNSNTHELTMCDENGLFPEHEQGMDSGINGSLDEGISAGGGMGM